MIEIAVYDTKPYDREYLTQAPRAERIALRCAGYNNLDLAIPTAIPKPYQA